MKRILLASVAMLGVSCSEPTTPLNSSISGHWLYNPGQCHGMLDPVGIFDLHIKNKEVYFGDSSKAVAGNWRPSPNDADVKKRARTFINNCPRLNVSAKTLASAPVYNFSGKHQTADFIELNQQWLMLDTDNVYWLVPFDKVKSSKLPLKQDHASTNT